MTTCFHKYTPPEGQTQVIARAQSISLIRCLFRLVKCKITEPLYKSAWYTLLSLLIFSTYALSIKREGHNLKKKKKKEISRLLRLLHSFAVMLSKARYCDIAVIATALLMCPFFEASFCTWRTAQGLNFFDWPLRGLFRVKPVLENLCMTLATVL